MIITTPENSRRNIKSSNSDMPGDILSIEKFNSLPGPVTARMIGGGEYWIETLCVQTGAMRIDVSGMIDHSEFAMISMLIDSNGDEHDPDDFWIDND